MEKLKTKLKIDKTFPILIAFLGVSGLVILFDMGSPNAEGKSMAPIMDQIYNAKPGDTLIIIRITPDSVYKELYAK